MSGRPKFTCLSRDALRNDATTKSTLKRGFGRPENAEEANTLLDIPSPEPRCDEFFSRIIRNPEPSSPRLRRSRLLRQNRQCQRRRQAVILTQRGQRKTVSAYHVDGTTADDDDCRRCWSVVSMNFAEVLAPGGAVFHLMQIAPEELSPTARGTFSGYDFSNCLSDPHR